MTENSIRLKIASVFVFIGFLMTLGLTAVTLLLPGGSQLHEAMDPQIIINDLASASAADIDIHLAGIVFDSFFIIGYMAIFYGLFVLTKDKEAFFPKLAFALGLTTGFCDLVENAIQVALFNGIPAGWSPDGQYFATLWSFTFVKDLTSYMAGMIFIVLLMITLSDPPNLRSSKLLLVILMGLYVVIGSIAVVESSFLLVRNMSFMVDMLLGALVLLRLSKAVHLQPG
ncbi:MAG: hypothetical protein ACFFEA_14740 [Candidatus Thorarchaeota archaeon]